MHIKTHLGYSIWSVVQQFVEDMCYCADVTCVHIYLIVIGRIRCARKEEKCTIYFHQRFFVAMQMKVHRFTVVRKENVGLS